MTPLQTPFCSAAFVLFVQHVSGGSLPHIHYQPANSGALNVDMDAAPQHSHTHVVRREAKLASSVDASLLQQGQTQKQRQKQKQKEKQSHAGAATSASNSSRHSQQHLQDATQAWAELVAWANANGGHLEGSSFHAASIPHAQTRIRGLVSSQDVEASHVLLRVPEKLWFRLENFQEASEARIRQLPACSQRSIATRNLIKLAAAIAVEIHKGPNSWYSEFLQQLPTLAYYRTFHLHFAKEDILRDFSDLPVTPLLRHMQSHDEELKTCFESWQTDRAKVGGPWELPSVSWENMELALMHVRTRAVSLGQHRGVAVVPGLDFFNTAGRTSHNVEWSLKENASFVEVTTKRGVPKGRELFTQYCKGCDNSRLLVHWGVMLDDNEHRLDPKADRGFCNVAPSSTAVASAGYDSAVALRNLVASLLDEGSTATSRPRCLAVTQASPQEAARRQAPLRCALAMLALEYCADTWSGDTHYNQGTTHDSGFVDMPEEPLFNGMTMQQATDSILSSAIGTD
mmetsp:Transcript_59934/g.126878  ORF Transcript_59934/g.126878 Transcript_59934/m.126878 type:complete len:514 (-) Transcript_59934:89-1630(-)